MKLTSANTERLCVRLFVWQRSTTLLNIVLLFISHRSWIVATLMQFIHKYRTTFKLIRFFLLQIYLLFVDHAYAKSFTVQIWCLCEKKKEMKTKSNIKSVLEILYFMLILWCSSQNIDRHSGLHVFDMFFIFLLLTNSPLQSFQCNKFQPFISSMKYIYKFMSFSIQCSHKDFQLLFRCYLSTFYWIVYYMLLLCKTWFVYIFKISLFIYKYCCVEKKKSLQHQIIVHDSLSNVTMLQDGRPFEKLF